MVPVCAQKPTLLGFNPILNPRRVCDPILGVCTGQAVNLRCDTIVKQYPDNSITCPVCKIDKNQQQSAKPQHNSPYPSYDILHPPYLQFYLANQDKPHSQLGLHHQQNMLMSALQGWLLCVSFYSSQYRSPVPHQSPERVFEPSIGPWISSLFIESKQFKTGVIAFTKSFLTAVTDRSVFQVVITPNIPANPYERTLC